MFLVMKAAVKCDKHCELHDSVGHQKFEIMLLFQVVLEIMFSESHCLCKFWCVCVCWSVCVDGFKMDVLVRTKRRRQRSVISVAHCEVHDWVNHLKVERTFLHRVF